MRIEEAITYAIMSDGRGKTTDQIADAINRNKLFYNLARPVVARKRERDFFERALHHYDEGLFVYVAMLPTVFTSYHSRYHFRYLHC